jgi:5-methyltetrahydrofolate--homocysteine methyltransferase
LRQQIRKTEGQPNFCLSDFIAPKDSGFVDHIGAFAICAGFGVDEQVKKYEQSHDDYHAILLKALADRLAEAGAEYLHEKVRKEIWGYAKQENLKNEELIREKYQGIRPAPGYPACPDHTEKDKLWQMLDVENNIGILLTESKAMYPTAAVSGWYFAHPDSKYFGIGEISEDQLLDYAQRKSMEPELMRRWLGSLMV